MLKAIVNIMSYVHMFIRVPASTREWKRRQVFTHMYHLPLSRVMLRLPLTSTRSASPARGQCSILAGVQAEGNRIGSVYHDRRSKLT